MQNETPRPIRDELVGAGLINPEGTRMTPAIKSKAAPSGKTKTMISTRQKIVIRDKLETLLTPEGDGWKYPSGYTDIRVAQEVDFPCTSANVAGVRKEFYGQLRTSPPVDDVQVRLQRLERVVRVLMRHAEIEPVLHLELENILIGRADV